jgi:hypothetical protein
MRIGWLAAELGVPISLGNTFLEIGVHMATALPEVVWLEYSFQNFDHLVETPIEIRGGYAYQPRGRGSSCARNATASATGRGTKPSACQPRRRLASVSPNDREYFAGYVARTVR